MDDMGARNILGLQMKSNDMHNNELVVFRV
jgi:hypothetical protein